MVFLMAPTEINKTVRCFVKLLFYALISHKYTCIIGLMLWDKSVGPNKSKPI